MGIFETTMTVGAFLLSLFIALLAMFTALGLITLRMDRRYRAALRQAEEKAEHAIQEARRTTEEAEAKTRARIDFLMERFNGAGANVPDDIGADYQVLEILINKFDEEELKALAFEVGIRWESLAGEKPVTRALSLTQAARNAGKMRGLVSIIRRDRPEAFRS